MPDNGIALERREAQGSCADGPARHGTPTPLKHLGPGNSACGMRPIARPAKGASQAPWRLPALHPLVEGRRKIGMTGHPGRRKTKNRGSGALANGLFEN